MPKKQSTAAKTARAAARGGAKYTAELREQAGPRRTVAVGELGDVVELADVRNALQAREGEHGSASAALGERECWNYLAVHDEWQTHAAGELRPLGLDWTPGLVWTTGGECVTVPETLTDAEAAQAWEQVTDGFEVWVNALVEAVRRGKPATSARPRHGNAPGGDWVVPVGPPLPMGPRFDEGVDLDAMTEYDAVTALVFNQTDDGDTGALAPHETFDWPMIEAEHTDQARARLGAHGIEWAPETGEVSCPVGMDAARARHLWDQIRWEADGRVLDLIDDIREGQPADADSERTAGHEWVQPL